MILLIDAGGSGSVAFFSKSTVPLAASTRRKGSNPALGGFGGLFDLKKCGFKDPVLVAANDGVGTKLKIAIDTGAYDTIGIDLVAMSVNDCICCGAEPLFFLDYVAMAKDDPPLLEMIVRGIADGDIFGPTDVYRVRLPLPGDSRPIIMGQVLVGMSPDDDPLEGEKNDPMMPLVWTRARSLDGGGAQRVLCKVQGDLFELKEALVLSHECIFGFDQDAFEIFG